MKNKMKVLVFVLGLLLSLPGFALAHGTDSVSTRDHHEKAPCDCHDGKHHHFMDHDWKAKMAEREQKLLIWVDQYTPEKKAEWTKVMAEKKTLLNQWLSPQNAAKREQWKKDRMTKMQELKKQYDEGKITKEEFMKKVHDGKHMGHWKMFHDLHKAVEAKDDKQAKVYLNQLLNHYKEHNQMMKDMLKK